MENNNNVLEIRGLHSYFFTEKGVAPAVDGLDLDIPKGKIIGLVGESGCGKSMTAKSIMGLLKYPGRVAGGSIRFEDQDLTRLSDKELRKICGNDISMIFQEPMTSLNPVFRCGYQIDEVIKLHNPELHKDKVRERSIEMLKLVGIANAEGVYSMFPHELSGGMRQRVMIAMALACSPGLIIADEPTTALDVTIQAQILDLLKELKDKINSSIMLITHDLGVVASMADRVAVMYAGKVVETGTCEDIFYRNAHPYTQALLKSLPSVDMNKTQRLVSIPGTPPDLLNPPKGCGFGARCTHCMKICHEEQPPVFKVGEGHEAACWLLHPDCPSAAERGEPDEQ